jgi:malonate transporter
LVRLADDTALSDRYDFRIATVTGYLGACEYANRRRYVQAPIGHASTLLKLNKYMALEIAEALVPVFFGMFLGYFAGARRMIDNHHVAGLNVLLMTLALPVALFVGVAQTSRGGLEEDGKLVFVLVVSMLVIFGITFALNHYVFRLSPGENAVQSLSVGFPNFAAVGLPLLGSVMGPGSAACVAASIAAGTVFISPITLTVLETQGKAAGSSLHPIATALFRSVCKPVVIAS